MVECRRDREGNRLYGTQFGPDAVPGQGGPVVARPWRLRHKLLLGLALVLAILGTLLAGSLLGLRSYIDTTKTTDSKLSELQFVEELRGAITHLTAPGGPRANEKFRLEQRLADVRERLEAYERQHSDTVRRRRDPDGGQHERDLIDDLARFCQQFQAALDTAAQASLADNPWDGLADHPEVKTAHGKLMQAADELRKATYDDVYHRITIAKSHQRRSVVVVTICASAALLLLAGILYFFYGWVLHPIRCLQQGVRQVADDGPYQPIQLRTGDELEELANAFDEMAARIKAQHADLVRQVNERSRQLVRSERLVSVGFLAAGVAHEINNPLASIAFCAEGLLRRMPDIAWRYPEEGETIQRYLGMIQAEAFRCKEITQNLLEFSRVGERRRELVDLTQLVQSVLEMAQLLPSSRGKQIVFRPESSPRALLNTQDIKSVVLNLIVNALDSMDEGGTLTIDLRTVGNMVELTFTDTGCGMEPEVLENIFEPFFTRSRTGRGTGLGLFISHQIIVQHEGSIEASSEGSGRGSVFVVRLPMQPAAALPSSAEQRRAA